MALLEVRNLEVYYGVICALKGISFDVNQGEIVTLIGANGAGKTTTMQSIVGLIPKRNGIITLDGKEKKTLNEGLCSCINIAAGRIWYLKWCEDDKWHLTSMNPDGSDIRQVK